MAEKAEGATKPTEGFDANFNMRAFRADIAEFYTACKTNGEPDGAKVVRRMMADYVEGEISYNVNQKEDD